MSNRITDDWKRFTPRDYLQEYYVDVSPENLALLQFAVKAFQIIPSNGVLLDFGGGPTIYPLIAAAKHVKEIHFCDYLDVNLNEVRLWLQGHHSAFDWQEFVKVTLNLESQDNGTAQTVLERKTLIRQRVTRVFNCDVRNSPPIDEPGAYDILVSNFCAESITDDWIQWRKFFHNITSLLKPNGFFLFSSLKGARCYAVGERFFPAVSLSENDITQALTEEGFDLQTIILESIPADPSSQYEGLITVLAQKLAI
ncbi:MAG: guanitoxin biosynthesis pre-guanitoxin forming N-methyltransferase GntF [Methylococcaceae bacterium]